MIRWRNLFFTTLVFVCFGAQAEVHEIKSMKEILSFVDAGTLLVFDIDSTVLNPFALPLAPVEAETPELIRGFQKLGARSMAMTARPFSAVGITETQLTSIDVHFSEKPVFPSEHVGIGKAIIPCNEDLRDVKLPPPPARDIILFKYKNGIAYTGDKNKGRAMVALLKDLDFKPTKIVFVDDKSKNTNNVNLALEALESGKIEHHEFRYGAMDGQEGKKSTYNVVE